MIQYNKVSDSYYEYFENIKNIQLFLDKYNEEVKVHNSNCCMLIDIAIKLGDLKSAKKAKSLAKPLLKWTLLGDWEQVVEKCRTGSGIYFAYRVSFDNSSITKVNNYFNEALRK